MTLARQPEPAVGPALLELGYHPDPGVGAAAWAALAAHVVPPEAFAPLVQAAELGAGERRVVALQALATSAGPRGVDVLVRLVDQVQGRRRAEVLEALFDGWPSAGNLPTQLDPPALERARRGALAGAEVGRRLDALDPAEGPLDALEAELARLGPGAVEPEALPGILRFLRAPGGRAGALACRLLEASGRPLPAEAGLQIFRAAAPAHRPYLASRCPGIAEPARRWFRRVQVEGGVSGRAGLRGLGLCGQAQDASALRAAATSECPARAPVALDSLALLATRSPEVVGQLEGVARLCAGAPAPEVRAAAVRLLAHLPRRRVRLEGMTRDPDPLVRGVALRVLFEAGPGRG